MESRVPIVLYGATGYTGVLIARELERRGARYAIAGRGHDKLTALQATLPSRPELLVADTSDQSALEAMAARGRVVLSCAGPFVDYGPPVQQAALSQGTHFLDITGEAGYMLETCRTRDAEARNRGVAIINAVGFDVIATDFPAWLACRGLGPIERLELAFANKGRPSQGTMRSALRAAKGSSLGYEDRVFTEVPTGRFRREIDFPPPVGRSWAISIPWGDIATAPRSTGAKTVRVYFRVRGAARYLAPLMGSFSRLARWKPVFDLLQRGIEARPPGPSEEERTRSGFVVVAEATDVAGRRQVVTLAGPGGYDFTAAAAAEAAIRASSPDFDRVGVLTPSQAFDVPSFLKVLEPHGVTCSVPG